MPPIPEVGDVVVRADRRNGMTVFVLYTVPGADQILAPTRHVAAANAVRFARWASVRAWRIDDTGRAILLGDHRMGAAPLPASRSRSRKTAALGASPASS